MALCLRLTRRSERLPFTNWILKRTASGRNYNTFRSSQYPELRKSNPLLLQCQPRRTFRISVRRAITGQEAPSAQAYIQSGVIGNKKKLVDVNKVLVIGSGGLSIGQAGEFDYSGACWVVQTVSGTSLARAFEAYT